MFVYRPTFTSQSWYLFSRWNLTWNLSLLPRRFKLQKKKRRSIFNDFSRIDSHHISLKETAFPSEDATSVSTNGEDATDCWNEKVLRVTSSAISKALFAKWTTRWAQASGKCLPVHDLVGICHYGQCDWLWHLSGRVIPSRDVIQLCGNFDIFVLFRVNNLSFCKNVDITHNQFQLIRNVLMMGGRVVLSSAFFAFFLLL